jgi:hypothetical protein
MEAKTYTRRARDKAPNNAVISGHMNEILGQRRPLP